MDIQTERMITQEQIIASYNQTNNYGNFLGMSFNIIQPGEVEVSMSIGEKHMATAKTAHGGAVAGLMDAALGVAGLSLASCDGKIVSTVEFKISYMRPALFGDSLKAIGKIVHAGKRIYHIEATIWNQYEELVATGNGTFNAYPVEKALD